MKPVGNLLYFGAFLSFTVVAQTHDAECQSEWIKSSAYSTCKGIDWTTKTIGVNPNTGYYEVDPRNQQPVKFCKLIQSCLQNGLKASEVDMNTYYSKENRPNVFTFRINELKDLKNCNGILLIKGC